MESGLWVFGVVRNPGLTSGATCLSPYRGQPASMSLPCRFFDDLDFLVGQVVEVVDKLVDLPIRGLDLPPNGRLVRRCLPGTPA